MEEWKEYKLGDIVDLVIDYRGKTPLKLGGSWSNSGYRALSAKNIKTGQIVNEDSIRFVDEDLYHKWMKDEVQRGDILITSEAPFGQIYFWDSEEKIVLSQRLFCLRLSNVVYPQFVYYYMTTHAFQHELDGRATGTTVVGLRQPELMKCRVKLPSYNNQIVIASILKSLDDKIEVNRRINDNLEQQAQALFKSWFVDFEPFKDGEFVESELGMIPKGWRVGKLGELCTFKRGKNLLTKDAIDGGVPVVAGGLEPSCYHNVSNTKSPVVTVSGSGANAGFMRMYYQEVWASDCSFIDTTCKNLLFVYCFLAVNRRLLRHAQTGAVQPHVKPSDIHDFDIVIPPQAIIEEFQTKIEESIQLRGNIEKENIRLATLRDTLLPKLMSGELNVFDKPNDQS